MGGGPYPDMGAGGEARPKGATPGRRSPDLGPGPIPVDRCLPAWGSRCWGEGRWPHSDGPVTPTRPHPLQLSSCPSPPASGQNKTPPSPSPDLGQKPPKTPPPQSLFWACLFLETGSWGCGPHLHQVKAPPRAREGFGAHGNSPPCPMPAVPSARGSPRNGKGGQGDPATWVGLRQGGEGVGGHGGRAEVGDLEGEWWHPVSLAGSQADLALPRTPACRHHRSAHGLRCTGTPTRPQMGPLLPSPLSHPCLGLELDSDVL